MSDSLVADELAIRSLVARYAEAVSSRNEAQWAATWTEDGSWSVMGQAPKGRDAVVALWKQLMGGLEFVVQHATSGHVELHGDRAVGRWQIIEFGKMPGGGAMMNIGFYKDECVRQGGEWLFERRVFSGLYTGPPDLSAPSQPFPVE